MYKVVLRYPITLILTIEGNIMSSKEAIDSVEFFSELDTARGDNNKVVTFYENVASNYNETLKEMGYTITTDYLASLMKENLGASLYT